MFPKHPDWWVGRTNTELVAAWGRPWHETNLGAIERRPNYPLSGYAGDLDYRLTPKEWEQLKGAVGAVFGSWMNDRAIVYRRKYNIPAEWGTAVNVQAMVFGNTGENSGSGVAFTRDRRVLIDVSCHR